jgi:pre-mRNA-splicing helicase BRR2
MTRTAKETKKEAEQLNVTATEPGISSALKDDDETDNQWDRQKQQHQDIQGGAVPSELDLEALAFTSGGHFMSNKKCDLPEGSWRAMRKGYEEVHVPAIRSIPKDEKLIDISELPPWTHAAFQGMDKLNRVQSKMYEVALHTSENLLLCAPTGAGKTNVAMLAVLNTLAQYKREGSGDSSVEFDLQAFKVVYVAPMKALVQEVVKNFGSRLSKYGITVKELR